MTTDLTTKDTMYTLVAALHAKGLHDLAIGLTDAVGVLYPPPPPPFPLPCPLCGSVLLQAQGTTDTWDHGTDASCHLYGIRITPRTIASWNRRAPCTACASLRSSWEAALARAEAAEKSAKGWEDEARRYSANANFWRGKADTAENRCAMALAYLNGFANDVPVGLQAASATLEGHDHA